MKKLITLVIALAALAGMQALANNEDLASKVADLQKQVSELQALLAAQKQDLGTVASRINALDEAYASAQEKAAAGGVSAGKADALKISGDLRLRYQNVRSGVGGPDNQFQTRFRLGLDWATSEGWAVGAGLASAWAGTTNNSNVTWSDGSGNSNFGPGFGKNPLALDYAYAKHTWAMEGMNLSLTGGQMVNPYKSSWLLWDEDTRPVGIVAALDVSGLFVTAGFHEVAYMGTTFNSSQMWAAQLGYQAKMDNVDFCLAVAGYASNDEPTQDLIGFMSGNAVDKDYNYRILDFYGDVGTKLGDLGLKLYGEWFRNFGAEGVSPFIVTDQADDNDTGLVVGLKGDFMNFTAGYAYARLESDSTNFWWADNTMTAAPDAKGHVLNLAYNYSKNASIGVAAYFLSEINCPDYQAEIYRLEATYKF